MHQPKKGHFAPFKDTKPLKPFNNYAAITHVPYEAQAQLMFEPA